MEGSTLTLTGCSLKSTLDSKAFLKILTLKLSKEQTLILHEGKRSLAIIHFYYAQPSVKGVIISMTNIMQKISDWYTSLNEVINLHIKWAKFTKPTCTTKTLEYFFKVYILKGLNITSKIHRRANLAELKTQRHQKSLTSVKVKTFSSA